VNKKYLIVKRIAIPILSLAMWLLSIAKNIGLSFEALASNVGNETLVIEQVQMPPADDSYANLLALGQTDLGVPTGTQQDGNLLQGFTELTTFPEFREYMNTLFGTSIVAGTKRGQLYTAWGYEKGTHRLIETDGAKISAYKEIVGRPTMQNLINAYRPQLIEASRKTFTDITGDEWYAGYISMPLFYGVISGMGDGTFQGDAYLTREQAIAMWALVINQRQEITDEYVSNISNGISDWAAPFWGRSGTTMRIQDLPGDQSHLYQGYIPRGEFCALIAKELFRDNSDEEPNMTSMFSDMQN
jgi:hypothetical protein